MWEYQRVRHQDGELTENRDWLRLAKDYAEIPREEFLEMVADWPREDFNEALRLRFRFDREFFLTYFWPEVFNLPFNDFQRWFLSRPKWYWRDRARMLDGGSDLRVTAAPRGNAKTTLGKGDMVHDTVYGIEGYTVVVGADLKAGAIPIVQDVIDMACLNERLHEVYGKITWKRHEEKKGLTVGDNPEVGFFARSFSVPIRGTNFGMQRPTKIIVDDGESSKRVLNPNNRAKDDAYLHEDVLKAGPPEGGLLLDWVGTVLHRDAQLPNLLNKPAWRGRVWKAITQWNESPENEALWAQCKLIWGDLTNDDREQDAKAFYLANKEAMDEGWTVLDPATWPIYRLKIAIWSEGLSSFLKERQNEVAISQYAYFDVGKFVKFTNQTDTLGRRYVDIQTATGEKVKSYVDEMTLLGYLDPVPGKDLGSLEDGAGAGDYAAFVILGKDKHGYIYVLDVWMERARDSEQIAKVWEMCEAWGVSQVAVETNNFARLVTRDFRRSQRERKERGEYFNVRFLDDHQSKNKEERIASLQPVASDLGWLRFSDAITQKILDQFTDFPNGAHDDAPDAIASCYIKLGGTPASPKARKLRRVI